MVHGGLKGYSGATLVLTFVPALCPNPTFAQSINSGTVTETLKDPSGAVVAGAKVLRSNPVTGYQQTTVADVSGT